MTHRGLAGVVAVVWALGGCVDEPFLPPPRDAGPPVTPRDAGPAPAHASRRVSRPLASRGGGLLVTSRYVYAVDPERDVVSVVASRPDGLELVGDVELPVGSEPGNLVEDGRGHVHVVLRGTGGVARLDGPELLSTRDVCAAPRGITWRATDDTLLVACADGFLAVLSTFGGPARLIPVESDLRDVVVAGDRVLVSRFLSAEVLALDGAGEIVARWRPEPVVRDDMLDPLVFSGGPPVQVTMMPRVALRMVPAPGGAWLLHQRERVEAIPATLADPEEPSVGAYGGGASRDTSNGCAPSMVEVAVTFVGATAPSGRLTSSAPIPAALPTDLSLSGDASLLVVAGGDSPTACFANLVTVPTDPSLFVEPHTVFAEASSVAHGRDTVYALALSPTRLIRLDDGGSGVELALGGSPEDPGHALFHQVTPSGLACASCHPEGGDDGHVWRFADTIGVRTQALRGGILDSAPFHWAGDMADFDALMAEGFVRRMSGAPPSRGELDALASWLDRLPAPPPPHLDASAIERGRRLFESGEVGCASCHSGSEYTASASIDVGTGRAFQPAVLLGVAYRAPYMHDGCAPTLRDVLDGDPACTGGASHVHTADLEPAEIDDLLAFVATR